jgi:hypothetical protein
LDPLSRAGYLVSLSPTLCTWCTLPFPSCRICLFQNTMT